MKNNTVQGRAPTPLLYVSFISIISIFVLEQPIRSRAEHRQFRQSTNEIIGFLNIVHYDIIRNIEHRIVQIDSVFML